MIRRAKAPSSGDYRAFKWPSLEHRLAGIEPSTKQEIVEEALELSCFFEQKECCAFFLVEAVASLNHGNES